MSDLSAITNEIGANDIEQFSAEHCTAREHSMPSRSKKVIPGPTFFPSKPVTTPAQTIDPIQGAVTGASASIALLPDRAYRFIASRAVYFRMTKGASAAVVGDIYLPANTAIVLLPARDYDTLSFIKAEAADTAGIAQAVEVK